LIEDVGERVCGYGNFVLNDLRKVNTKKMKLWNEKREGYRDKK